jgi:hypothetical protein
MMSKDSMWSILTKFCIRVFEDFYGIQNKANKRKFMPTGAKIKTLKYSSNFQRN